MEAGGQDEEDDEYDCSCQGWVIMIQLRVAGVAHFEVIWVEVGKW